MIRNLQYFHGERSEAGKYEFCTHGTNWPMELMCTWYELGSGSYVHTGRRMGRKASTERKPTHIVVSVALTSRHEAKWLPSS